LQAFYPFLATLAAYLLGSLSFAVIVSRVMGLQDPRTFGSKNPGATNVLVRLYGKPYGLEDGTVAMAGLAAFLGHLYPLFFRFQGGKGVATFLGVVFGVHPLLGAATAATWLIIAFFFRYSSLASLVAAVFAPCFYLLGDHVAWYAETPIALALAVMALLLGWRHSENIARLLQGKESKLGAKKAKV
jgi:glycerol-3-phosphate acyltransferase PlsY